MRRELRENRPAWIKQRRLGARPVLACANAFFRAANSPLRAIIDMAQWQQREVASFQLLHGSEFHASIHGPAAVAIDEVPGINLTVPLDNGSITPSMTAAAGRELRRAHSLECPVFRGPWSHGDPHLGNFVFEASTDRARLIDFEVIHQHSIPPDQRHADDLLVFLQDMAGRIAADQWLPCAHAFLQGYDRPEIVRLLQNAAIIPCGIARIWWNIRTGALSRVEWETRIAALNARAA